MRLEIERKYLLKSSNIIEILKKDGINFNQESIVQFYTSISEHSETRLRKSDNKFTIATKRGIGMVREEKEESINKKLFNLAKKNILGEQITKSRYSFKFQNFPANIDIYEDNLLGLFILEIEFNDEDIAIRHKLPQIFEDEIIKEVTDDKKYKNKYLSLYGNPIFLTTQLNELITNVEREPMKYDFLPYLPPASKAYDCLRVVFLSLLEKTIYHQKQYINYQYNEDLHQFRVNIRKFRSLLQCMDKIFDINIQKRFIIDLKTIANASNSKRDMDVFLEYLDNLDDLEAEKIFKLLKDSQKDSNEVISLFESQDYNNIIEELGVVLRDENGFFEGENAKLPYKKVGAIAIAKRLKKMKNKLNLLDEWAELEKFHSIRIEFKKLRYITEYFSIFFGHTNIKKLSISSKKMQNIFGLLQDRDVGFNILKNMDLNEEFISNVEIMQAKELLCEIIQDEIYSLKCDILYSKKKFKKLLNKCLKELEVYVGD